MTQKTQLRGLLAPETGESVPVFKYLVIVFGHIGLLFVSRGLGILPNEGLGLLVPEELARERCKLDHLLVLEDELRGNWTRWVIIFAIAVEADSPETEASVAALLAWCLREVLIDYH